MNYLQLQGAFLKKESNMWKCVSMQRIIRHQVSNGAHSQVMYIYIFIYILSINVSSLKWTSEFRWVSPPAGETLWSVSEHQPWHGTGWVASWRRNMADETEADPEKPPPHVPDSHLISIRLTAAHWAPISQHISGFVPDTLHCAGPDTLMATSMC